jgi:hypothetical protein
LCGSQKISRIKWSVPAQGENCVPEEERLHKRAKWVRGKRCGYLEIVDRKESKSQKSLSGAPRQRSKKEKKRRYPLCREYEDEKRGRVLAQSSKTKIPAHTIRPQPILKTSLSHTCPSHTRGKTPVAVTGASKQAKNTVSGSQKSQTGHECGKPEALDAGSAKHSFKYRGGY